MFAIVSIAPEEDVRPIARELIRALMGAEVDEQLSKICEDNAMTQFYHSKGGIPHPNDVQKSINGLALKFELNGLFDLSTSFKCNIERFTSEYRKLTVEHPDVDNFSPSLTLPGCEWRILHFLHLMSWNPVQREVQRLKTTLDNLEVKPEPSSSVEDKTEVFDWGAYLKEGLPVWNAPLESDSDESQLSEDQDEEQTDEQTDEQTTTDDSSPVQDDSPPPNLSDIIKARGKLPPHLLSKVLLMFKEEISATAFLASNTQEPWWLPKLFKEPGLEIITEYCLIREILWLLTAPSFETRCFKIKDDLYVPTHEMVIEGIHHQETLRQFMNSMCEFMNMVMALEEFSQSLKALPEFHLPKTFVAYNAALNTFLRTFKSKVSDIERKVLKQDSCMTLLVVLGTLEPWLNNLRFVTALHQEATADWEESPKWVSTLWLLSVWLDAAMGVTSKRHVTIAFNIFLKSFQPYFRTIDHWLRFGHLDDPIEEFFICRPPSQYGVTGTISRDKMWDSGFIVHPFNECVRCDILSPRLLQLILTGGKTIDVIQSIGKIRSVQPAVLPPVEGENYLQLLHGIERSLSRYQKVDYSSHPRGALSIPLAEEHRFVTCLKVMDNPINTELIQEASIYQDDFNQVYERIASHTCRMFVPIANILEVEEMAFFKPMVDLLSNTLNNILIEDHHLHVRLAMMRTLFFLDHPNSIDIFKSLFMNRNLSDHMSNNWSLTMALHDIMEELYPTSHKSQYGLVVNNNFYAEDNLMSTIKFITYVYPVEWPLSIIITPSHVELYNSVFHFLLPLKWALYIVGHLPTRGCKEDKNKLLTESRSVRYQALRLWLLSSLSGLNVFFLDYILENYTKTMQDRMHRATNFEMFLEAHDEYLAKINNLCCGYGTKLTLYIKQLLELASCFAATWPARDSIRMDSRLTDMEDLYCTLHRQITLELDDLLASELEDMSIYEGLYCTFNPSSLPNFGREKARSRK